MSVFDRLTASVLARLGRDAFLRTGEACRVHIEHGVEVTGLHGEVTVEKTVATMLKGLAPKIGDALVVGTDSYVIDSPPFQDNGHSVRVIVREA